MLMFSQKEVEEAFDDILKHADRAEISRITGIYNGVIDGMFNPNDERKSALFVALQILCAEDQIDEARGDALLKKFLEFRELSKKRVAADSSVSVETSHLNREVAEYISARIEGKPFHVQMSEFLDIERQLGQLKQALLDEYNKSKETPAESSVNIFNIANR